MARARNKLTARQAETLKRPGRHSDGGGLYLAINSDGPTMRRRWLYLFPWNGKRPEMGLGGFPAVSLADARKARDEAERLVRQGINPIEARDDARDRRASKPTFGQIADALFASKSSEWRSEKHRDQWRVDTHEGCGAQSDQFPWTKSTRRQCWRFSRPCGPQSQKPHPARVGGLRPFWTPRRRRAIAQARIQPHGVAIFPTFSRNAANLRAVIMRRWPTRTFPRSWANCASDARRGRWRWNLRS